MVMHAQSCQILTYGDMFPNRFFIVVVFICIYFVELFTDGTHKLIVSFPYKQNAVLKNFIWKGQKTVGHLLVFRSLLLLVTGGVTHFILMPLHFVTVQYMQISIKRVDFC
jgi:hypothetical protein